MQNHKEVEINDKELLGYGEQDSRSRSLSHERKSGESSPDRSEYEDTISEPSTKPVALIDAYNTKSGFNVRLKNEQGTAMYYIEHSVFTPKKPDVIIHAGAEKTDPILAVCRWSSMYAKTVTIGLGDPSTNESGVQWEEMRTESVRHIEWAWKLEEHDGSTRNFAWQRADAEDRQKADLEGSKWSSKNFKLIEKDSGQVVAVFVSNRYKSWSKLGKYKVFVDYGEKWRLLMLLTVSALIEMSRRRARARRNHGGGY